jgi:hypothetical protein
VHIDWFFYQSNSSSSPQDSARWREKEKKDKVKDPYDFPSSASASIYSNLGLAHTRLYLFRLLWSSVVVVVVVVRSSMLLSQTLRLCASLLSHCGSNSILGLLPPLLQSIVNFNSCFHRPSTRRAPSTPTLELSWIISVLSLFSCFP